jgi:hypothetical protein
MIAADTVSLKVISIDIAPFAMNLCPADSWKKQIRFMCRQPAAGSQSMRQRASRRDSASIAFRTAGMTSLTNRPGPLFRASG